MKIRAEIIDNELIKAFETRSLKKRFDFKKGSRIRNIDESADRGYACLVLQKSEKIAVKSGKRTMIRATIF